MTRGSDTINLLIDRGNSFCKVATARRGIISPIAIFPQLTAEILDHYMGKCDRQVAAIYSKVGSDDSVAINYLRENARTLVTLDSDTRVPLSDIRYDRTKLGSDRLALAVGAAHLYPHHAALIVDIGTAITYDFVDERAVYLGGDITPGPRTRSKSLMDATAQLPDTDFMTAPDHDAFATTTTTAIANGITRGIVAEIESYIARAKQICPSVATIITGGYGSFFANRKKNKTFAVPNLLMIGLNKILEYNDPSDDK